MPFPLHKAPSGLLEWFRLRTLGANPPQFGDTVTPVADVLGFYGADLYVAASVAGSAAAITGGAADIPAAAYPRRVVAVSGGLLFGAAAGSWVTLAVGIIVPAAGTVLTQLAAINDKGTLIAASRYNVCSGPLDLYLPPGHVLRCSSNGDATGTDHVKSIAALWQRLDGVA